MKKAKWQKFPGLFGGISYTLFGKGFAVSYNPDIAATAGPLAVLFRSDNGGPETALINDDGEYFILNGDFRDQYERLVPQGWDACKQFYDQQTSQHASFWSTEKKMSS